MSPAGSDEISCTSTTSCRESPLFGVSSFRDLQRGHRTGTGVQRRCAFGGQHLARGEAALRLSNSSLLCRTGLIEYVAFPEKLRGKYQAYTQADLARLRARDAISRFGRSKTVRRAMYAGCCRTRNECISRGITSRGLPRPRRSRKPGPRLCGPARGFQLRAGHAGRSATPPPIGFCTRGGHQSVWYRPRASTALPSLSN